MTYASQVLASGATGYWKLAEASGAFVDSYTTTPHDLTLTGTASRAQTALFSESAGSVKFNGTASLLSGTSPAAVSTGSFTFEFLVKYDTAPAGTEGLFSLVNNTNLISTQSARLYVFSSMVLGFGAVLSTGPQIYCTAPFGLSLGVTHHIVIQFESAVALRMYIDGALVQTTATAVPTLTAGNNTIVIGAAYEPFYGASNMSDAAYYPTILSAGTVMAHAAAAIPGLGNRMNASIAPLLGVIGGYGAATFDLSPLAPTATGYSGATGFAGPPLATVVSAGHDATGERSLTAAPVFGTLLAFGGANLSAAPLYPTLAVTGTNAITGVGVLSPLVGTVAATGTVAQGGSSSPYLGPQMATLVGYAGSVVSITGLNGTVQATGTVGSVGAFTITAPLYALDANGTVNGLSYADISPLPPEMGATARIWAMPPMARLTAIGTATVAVTYEAYAVNLKHSGENPTDEVTHYTNFPFDRIVRYKNSYFGMNATGLYLLEGTTDNGTPTSFAVQTHKTDFDSSEKKTVVSLYMGGRIGAAETVSIIAGETTPNAYSYTTPRGPLAQNYRQKFGRGIKSRYYAFAVAGSDTFRLDALEPEINKLTRRI